MKLLFCFLILLIVSKQRDIKRQDKIKTSYITFNSKFIRIGIRIIYYEFSNIIQINIKSIKGPQSKRSKRFSLPLD